MMRYIFGLLFLILFLSGCVPRYTIKHLYIPPVGTKAKQCLQTCKDERVACDIKCQDSYNNCLNKAFLRAKDIKGIEDTNYDKAYESYLQKLNEYKNHMLSWQSEYDKDRSDWSYFQSKCKNRHDRYACSRVNELSWTLRKMINIKPKEPQAPIKKSFVQILKNEQKVCKSDCGCQNDYDTCFLNCGGEIQLKKICIANCDKN